MVQLGSKLGSSLNHNKYLNPSLLILDCSSSPVKWRDWLNWAPSLELWVDDSPTGCNMTSYLWECDGFHLDNNLDWLHPCLTVRSLWGISHINWSSCIESEGCGLKQLGDLVTVMEQDHGHLFGMNHLQNKSMGHGSLGELQQENLSRSDLTAFAFFFF